MVQLHFWLVGILVLGFASLSHADKEQNRQLKTLLGSIQEKSGLEVHCGSANVETCLKAARTLASVAEDKTIQNPHYRILFSHRSEAASPDGFIFVGTNDTAEQMRNHIANQYFDVSESKSKIKQLELQNRIGVFCSIQEGQACKTAVDKIDSLKNVIDMQGMKIIVSNTMQDINLDSFILIDWRASRLTLLEHLKKQR